MSADVSTLVWRSGVYEGSTLVVLLALAEYANPDGTRIYPRLGNLMEKARLSERSTREAIRQLRKDGLLILVKEADRRNGLEHEWRIDVMKLYALAYAKWEKDQRGKPPPLPPETDRQNLPSKQNLPQGEAKSASKSGKICHPPCTPYIDSTVIQPSSPPAPNGAAKRRASSKLKTTIGDYTPSDEARQKAVAYWEKHDRLDLVAKLEDEVFRFLGNHRARGSRMVDWDSAWQTWYCNALSMNRPPPPNGNGRGHPGATGVSFEQTNTNGWYQRLLCFYGHKVTDDPETSIAKGTWNKTWGPRPETIGCKVPEEAYTQFRQQHQRRMA